MILFKENEIKPHICDFLLSFSFELHLCGAEANLVLKREFIVIYDFF